MRCFGRGKVSATTLAREISTPPQKQLWIAIAETSHGKLSKCDNFLESGNTPRMPLPALPSINLWRSSKRTPLAFWRGFLICENQSIQTRAGEHFGIMQHVFSRNLMARLSTPLFSISARLFA